MEKIAKTIFLPAPIKESMGIDPRIRQEWKGTSICDQANCNAENLFDDGKFVGEAKKAIHWFSKIKNNNKRLGALAKAKEREVFLDIYAEMRIGLLFYFSLFDVISDPNNLDYEIAFNDVKYFLEVTRIRDSERYEYKRLGTSNGTFTNCEDFKYHVRINAPGLEGMEFPLKETIHHEITEKEIVDIQLKLLGKLREKIEKQFMKEPNTILVIWDDRRDISLDQILAPTYVEKDLSECLNYFSGLIWMAKDCHEMRFHSCKDPSKFVMTTVQNNLMSFLCDYHNVNKVRIIVNPFY